MAGHFATPCATTGGGILSLSSARELAAESVRAAQKQYKGQYDKKAQPTKYQLGDWVLANTVSARGEWETT